MSDEVTIEEEGTAPTDPAEVAKTWLESDEGKAWLQPTLDRTVAKALKTHDEKQAPEIEKRIEAEREKARKEGSMSTEERLQEQIKDLQQKFSDAESKAERQTRNAELLKYATENKVPAKMLSAILANPGALDDCKASIDAIAEGLEETRKAGANETLVNDSHKPGSGDSGDSTANIEGLDWNNPADREKLLAAVADES